MAKQQFSVDALFNRLVTGVHATLAIYRARSTRSAGELRLLIALDWESAMTLRIQSVIQKLLAGALVVALACGAISLPGCSQRSDNEKRSEPVSRTPPKLEPLPT